MSAGKWNLYSPAPLADISQRKTPSSKNRSPDILPHSAGRTRSCLHNQENHDASVFDSSDSTNDKRVRKVLDFHSVDSGGSDLKSSVDSSSGHCSGFAAPMSSSLLSLNEPVPSSQSIGESSSEPIRSTGDVEDSQSKSLPKEALMQRPPKQVVRRKKLVSVSSKYKEESENYFNKKQDLLKKHAETTKSANITKLSTTIQNKSMAKRSASTPNKTTNVSVFDVNDISEIGYDISDSNAQNLPEDLLFNIKYIEYLHNLDLQTLYLSTASSHAFHERETSVKNQLEALWRLNQNLKSTLTDLTCKDLELKHSSRIEENLKRFHAPIANLISSLNTVKEQHDGIIQAVKAYQNCVILEGVKFEPVVFEAELISAMEDLLDVVRSLNVEEFMDSNFVSEISHCLNDLNEVSSSLLETFLSCTENLKNLEAKASSHIFLDCVKLRARQMPDNIANCPF